MSSEQLNRRNILEMDQEIIRLRRSEKKYRAEIDRLKAQLEVMHNEMERHNEYSDRLHRQLADKDKRIAELEEILEGTSVMLGEWIGYMSARREVIEAALDKGE